MKKKLLKQFALFGGLCLGSFYANHTYSQGMGVGIAVPISVLHVYENTGNVDALAGLTIEQDGAGDAVLQYLLTGGQRWVSGIDQDDASKFKIRPAADLGSSALAVTIQATGEVGIGIASPASVLHVVSPATTTAGMTLAANSVTSGQALNISSTAAGLAGNALLVTTGSTSAITDGQVYFNFPAAHTSGAGFRVDAGTTAGNAMVLNANALVAGNGLVVAGTGTGLTGNMFSVTSASTAALTNGVARLNFSAGARTGNGFQIDDATTAGNAMQLNANALVTGKAFSILNTGTALTTAGANTGSLLDVSTSGANTIFTGSLANISMAGASAAGNTGSLLNINDAGAANLTKLLTMNSSSTANTTNILSLTTAVAGAITPTSGIAHFNFAGNRTALGVGFQIDDASTALATTMQINANSLTTGTALDINATATTTGFALDVTGNSIFTQHVHTTGSPTALTVTGAAHTTLAATVEAPDINFNLARTAQFATGGIATQRAIRIQAPTYAFVGASTITTAATVAIEGAPVAGANATLTKSFGLDVNADCRVGWHGSNTRLKVLPTDFAIDDDDTDDDDQDNGFTIEDDGANFGIRLDETSNEMFTWVVIPVGYKATHIRSYGLDANANATWAVYEIDLTAGTRVDPGTNTGVWSDGADVDITDINCTTTNALLIEINPGDNTDILYSMIITIAPI